MQFEQDYYATLGISPDADENALKQAYRQLARLYHPDTSQEPDAAARFLEVQEAYELLGDPLRREAYDHWRKQQGLDLSPPLHLRVTPSQSTLGCLNEKQLLYVLIEITASKELDSERLPLNLGLVLDRSTSMKGARLQQVKESARHIVDQMQPEDILSLITFSDRAQVVLPGQRSLNKTEARTAISSIYSSGGTELLQGLELGLQQVQRWLSDEVHSHLILLTDGQTYGDELDCLEAAKLAGEQGIPLTMIGVGYDWNDKLLDEMADLSHGSSVFIDSPSQISQVFKEQIQALGMVVSHNLRLNIHLAERVSLREIYRVSPQINRLRLTEESVILGSLEQHKPQAVILELLLDSHTPGSHRLLQVTAEGAVLSLSRQTARATREVVIPFDSRLGRRTEVPSDIVAAMGKLTIFKMQERAVSEVEQGNIGPAVDRLKTLATRLLDVGEPELARAALLEAGRLARTGSLSTKGLKKIRYGTRGLTILPKEVQQ